MSQHTKIEQMEKLVEEYNAPILGYKKKIGSPLIRSFTYDLDDIPIGQDIVNYVERNGVLGRHNRITLEDIEYSIIPREAGGGVGGLFGFTLKADIGVGAAPLLKAVLQEKLGIEDRELKLYKLIQEVKAFIKEENKSNSSEFLETQERFLNSLGLLIHESKYSHLVNEEVKGYRLLHDIEGYSIGDKVQDLPILLKYEIVDSIPTQRGNYVSIKLDEKEEVTKMVYKYFDELSQHYTIYEEVITEFRLTNTGSILKIFLKGYEPKLPSSYIVQNFYEYKRREFASYDMSHKELAKRLMDTTITNFLVTEDTMKGFSKRNIKEKREIMNKIDSIKNYFLCLSYNGKKQFLDTVGRKIVAYSERLNVTSLENGKSVLLEKMPEFIQKMLDDAKQLYDKDRDSILKLASSDKFEDNSLREDLLWHSKRLKKRLKL